MFVFFGNTATGFPEVKLNKFSQEKIEKWFVYSMNQISGILKCIRLDLSTR